MSRKNETSVQREGKTVRVRYTPPGLAVPIDMDVEAVTTENEERRYAKEKTVSL